MIRVGQKVRYDPLDGIKGFALSDLRTESTGTVVYINEKHRWFSVVNDERSCVLPSISARSERK